MKKILLRLLAFALDVGTCSFIILGVSMLSFINPNSDKINAYYREINSNREQYKELSEDLDTYLEDGMLSDVEFNEILVKYPSYTEVFKDLKINEDIKNKEIAIVKDRINEKNVNISNGYIIKINKLNWVQVIISLVVYVLYFGVLQYFMKGQTPFKRLFRLKVVNKNGQNISLISFIIRSLLISEIIISLIDLGLLFALNNLQYISCNYWLTQFKYIYDMGFLVCMIVRDDMRSIHDLILGTEVIRYDKFGKKINDVLFIGGSDDDQKNNDKND